jgi:AcrR family transcriptional regulator
MEERSRRILEIAVELAEEGGFDAVRQRDVAARAGVALGTLYKRFPSKEGILVAALELETEKMVKRITAQPIAGDTPIERVTGLFKTLTRGLVRKPNLARALIKAVTSGEPELTEKVAGYHTSMKDLVVTALVGPDGKGGERESEVAYVLQKVWFATVVGWMGGLHTQAAITDQVSQACEWILKGAEA